DAAEGGLAGGGDAVVDAEHAGFESFREAEHSADVARESIGAEAVTRLVGLFNRLSLTVERTNGSDGCKSLFEHAQRAFGDVREPSCFKKPARTGYAFAAAEQTRAAAERILDVFGRFSQRVFVNQRTDVRPWLQSVADV